MHLRALRTASRALERMQASLEAKMQIMERAVRPAALHYGLHSLPNEILLHIVRFHTELGPAGPWEKMASSRCKDLICRHVDVRKLAFVSKKFLNVVRSLPWVYKSLEDRDEAIWGVEPEGSEEPGLPQTPMYLMSSPNVAMDVLLTSVARSKTVLTRAKSWRKLIVAPSIDKPLAALLDRDMVRTVETLEVYTSGHESQIGKFLRPDSRLRHLTLVDHPLSDAGLQGIVPSLSTLSISSWIRSEQGLKDLSSILSGGVKLVHLELQIHLKLESGHEGIGAVEHDPNLSRYPLDKLQSLKISFNGDGWTEHPALDGSLIATILRSTTRLHSFEVEGEGGTNFFNMLPHEYEFNVKSFAFNGFQWTTDAHAHAFIFECLRCFPHMESLHVMSCCLVSVNGPEIAAFAQLYELDLTDCKLPENFFQVLFQQDEFNLKRITLQNGWRYWGHDVSTLEDMSDKGVGTRSHWSSLINSKLSGNFVFRFS